MARYIETEKMKYTCSNANDCKYKNRDFSYTMKLAIWFTVIHKSKIFISFLSRFFDIEHLLIPYMDLSNEQRYEKVFYL